MAITLLPTWAELETYPSKRQRGAMTSAAKTEAGSGPNAEDGSNPQLYQFDAVEGFNPNGGSAQRYDLSFLSDQDLIDLVTEGYHHFELSDNFTSDNPPASDYGFVSYNSKNGWVQVSSTGNFQSKLFSGAGSSGGEWQLSSVPVVSGEGVVFDVLYNGSCSVIHL